MKLWCFGDSNTYGYDPCGFFCGRYDSPWPELLAEKTGAEVINDGKNGRMIPGREYELQQFHRDTVRYAADAYDGGALQGARYDGDRIPFKCGRNLRYL